MDSTQILNYPSYSQLFFLNIIFSNNLKFEKDAKDSNNSILSLEYICMGKIVLKYIKIVGIIVAFIPEFKLLVGLLLSTLSSN